MEGRCCWFWRRYQTSHCKCFGSSTRSFCVQTCAFWPAASSTIWFFSLQQNHLENMKLHKYYETKSINPHRQCQPKRQRCFPMSDYKAHKEGEIADNDTGKITPWLPNTILAIQGVVLFQNPKPNRTTACAEVSFQQHRPESNGIRHEGCGQGGPGAGTRRGTAGQLVPGNCYELWKRDWRSTKKKPRKWGSLVCKMCITFKAGHQNNS